MTPSFASSSGALQKKFYGVPKAQANQLGRIGQELATIALFARGKASFSKILFLLP
eukprot:SAG31_NODE_855_length_11461_cov_5.496215_7_plen_56_part_00